MLRSAFLYFSLLVCSSVWAHPFYVSVLEMRYNEKSNTLECALKLFTDDLETAIEQSMGHNKLFLSEQREHHAADSLIWKYVSQRIKINNKPLRYVGREGNIDAQWIYFEIPVDPKDEHSLLLWNTFVEVLPGQKNILHFRLGANQQTYIFDKKNTSQNLSLRL